MMLYGVCVCACLSEQYDIWLTRSWVQFLREEGREESDRGREESSVERSREQARWSQECQQSPELKETKNRFSLEPLDFSP